MFPLWFVTCNDTKQRTEGTILGQTWKARRNTPVSCKHNPKQLVSDKHFASETPETFLALECGNLSEHFILLYFILFYFIFSLLAFLKKYIYLFIYFWLCWVFVVARGLSLVAVCRGYSLLQCACFSLRWLLLLRSVGSRCAGFSSCGTRAQ